MKLIYASFIFLSLINVSLAEKPIKIGVISDLSGSASKLSRYQNIGITLAKEELEKKGKQFELIFEDSEANTSKAISAYEKLVVLDKVEAVITNDSGFVVAPLLTINKRHEKLMLSNSMPHKKYCEQGGGYFYSIASRISVTKKAFKKFFRLNEDVKKIAMFISDKHERENSYKKIITEVVNSFGVEIVYVFKSADLNSNLNASFLKAIKKKPDALFIARKHEDLLKMISKYKFKGKILFTNHVFEILANSMQRKNKLKGYYVVNPVIRDNDNFREKFKKRFSKEPILEAYVGYESMITISKAFKFNREKPYLGIQSVAYRGAFGIIDFSGNSCAGNFANWGLYKFFSELEKIS